MGISKTPAFRGPLKTAQMLGARRSATGAYMEVREDRGFPGNLPAMPAARPWQAGNADGQFSEVPLWR